MDVKWNKSAQRLLALILCVAMLLPVMTPQSARAAGRSTADDAVGITGYGGVVSAQDNLSVTDAILKAETTDMPQIAFEKVTKGMDLIHEGQYLLMSDKYGHIMSHDAVTPDNENSWQVQDSAYASWDGGNKTAGSIKLDADGNSLNTYYIGTDGKVYLDQSNRHFVLWDLTQDAKVLTERLNSTARTPGQALDETTWYNFGTQKKLYEGIQLKKLMKGSAGYWYCDNVAENSDYQLRYLCFRVDSTPFRNYLRYNKQSSNVDDMRKYVIEYVGDDTFLIYFKMGDNDFRFVCCDSAGNWKVKRYENSSADVVKQQVNADLNELKVRFYRYAPTNADKRVTVGGYQSYTTKLNVSLDDLKAAIVSKLNVFDPDHKNQQIPYSESRKSGHYSLDASDVITSESGVYPVYVAYIDDNGERTDVGTLTVYVAPPEITVGNKQGYVSQNSYSEVHTALDSTNIVTFKFGGKTVNITVGMLKNADGTPFKTTASGTYNNLTLKYNGWTICTDFTVTVGKGTIPADMPVYPEPGSVKVDKFSTTTEDQFALTGVANIELTATAKPIQKGVDVLIMMDLSSSMRYYANSSEYACGPKYEPDGDLNTSKAKKEDENGNEVYDLEWVYNDEWWTYTRMYALEQSLNSVVTNLRNSNADVRIALADFGDLNHFEFDKAVIDKNYRSYPVFERDSYGTVNYRDEMSNHLNFVLGRDDSTYHEPGNAAGYWVSQPYALHKYKYINYDLDSTSNVDETENYTGKLPPMVYTNSDKNNAALKYGMVNADAFVDVSTLTKDRMDQIIEDMRRQNSKMLGTNYDVGLEYTYRLAYARQLANIEAGLDRDIIVIFMSDGAAMQYNYLSGRSHSEAWSQCIIGETDEILTSFSDAYSWSYDEGANRHPQLQNLLAQMHQRLAAGNLDSADTGSHFKRCGCSVSNAGADSFFAHLIGSGNGFTTENCSWDNIFKILYWNTNGDAGDIFTDANGNNTLDGNEALQFRRDFIKSLRAPSYKTDGKGNFVLDANGNKIQYQYQTYSPYYYFYNAEGLNWWAEAIKGDPDKTYPVVNILAKNDTYWPSNLPKNAYNGEEGKQNHFSGETTKGLALNGQDYISGYQGLGLPLYTIGFAMAQSDERRIGADEARLVLDRVATSAGYHFEAADTASLTAALNSIIEKSYVSASMSYYTDTMGDDYDLSTEITVKDDKGVTHTVNQDPTVRALRYTLDMNKPVYDDNGKITGYERAKDENGKFIYEVIETIKFAKNAFGAASAQIVYAAEGTKVAYSDLVYTVDSNGVKTYQDIWNDATGLIAGKYVQYNTNKYVSETNTGAVRISFGAQGSYMLPAETFFWSIGFLDETEVVLEYQAYLTGSIENGLPYGKNYYDTNEQATLGYVDYLGNNCQKENDTPKFPWEEVAKVAYVFYVTDEDGNMLDDNGNITKDFTKAKKLTVLSADDFKKITSDETTLDASALFDATEFTSDYELLYPDAEYDVNLNQIIDGEIYHYWDSENGNGTTYVTIDGGKSYSHEDTNYDENKPNSKLDESVVYFAVKQKVKPTVGYVFYVVDENGKPLDQNGKPLETDADGNIINFADAYKLNDAVYSTVNGKEYPVDASDVFTGTQYDYLYDLYSPDASYVVYYDKEVDGVERNYWESKDGNNTTYVTTDGGSTFSNGANNLSDNNADPELMNSVVYFAVTAPKVGYSFYLVDEDGKPIDASGNRVDDFKDSEKVLDPSFQYVIGDGATLNALDVFNANPELADLYELYSPDATFDAIYNEAKDTTDDGQENPQNYNYWKTEDKKDSTYVTTDKGSSYSKENTNFDADSPNAKMSESLVYYALRLKEQASEDVIVIDFGLSVNIHVLDNDNLTEKSTVVGISSNSTPLVAGTKPDSSFKAAGEPVGDVYGSAVINASDNTITYSLNTMHMVDAEVFTYVAKDAKTNYHYYSTVTVIPATTIYYEDNSGLITYSAYEFTPGSKDRTPSTTAKWSDTPALSGVQDEDRPGQDVNDVLGALDADSLYGYDSHYTNMQTYSMNSAKSFTATKETVAGKTVVTYGTAEFTFTGTGFDVISLTSGDTGVITVEVLREETKNGVTSWVSKVKRIVDTYYGFKFDSETQSWSPVDNSDATVGTTGGNTLYQVPVMKINDLDYGQYKVVITITYNEFFDHQDNGSYDFYLDAIRIYDPAEDGKNNTVIENAYKADKEGWPEYFELRNMIIARGDLNYTDGTNAVANGVVFIDNVGTNDEFDVADYKNFGPNNELYLAPKQSIVFDLNVPGTNVASIQLALKSVGGSAKIKVYDAGAAVVDNILPSPADSDVTTISTATDLYYNITGLNNKTVVITNVGESSDAILSITNVKVTYTSEHEDSIEQGYFTVSSAKIMEVLNSMNKTEEVENGSETNSGITMTNASLSLEDEVLVNFYFNINDSALVTLNGDGSVAENVGLLVWNAEPDASAATYDKADAIINGALVDSKNNRYMVHTNGIPAKNLGDNLYVRVFIEKADGTYLYGKIVTYSPKTYAYNRLENSNNENMKKLCVALLNYGAAAQEYFGYKTNRLVNAGLSEEQVYNSELFSGAKATVNSAKASSFGITGTGFNSEKSGASVSFEGAFAINYYFEPTNTVQGDVTFYYWTAEAYNSASKLTAANASGSLVMKNTGTGRYWAAISGIAAKAIDEPYYAVAVYSDGVNNYSTGVKAYSVSKYCVNLAASETASDAMKDLATATAMYGYYAKQYFNTSTVED